MNRLPMELLGVLYVVNGRNGNAISKLHPVADPLFALLPNFKILNAWHQPYQQPDHFSEKV